MKYIIMCGGTYPAFTYPRQLTIINGETLVERTIRLLKENGIEDICISATDKRFDSFGVPVLKHDNIYMPSDRYTHWVDGFYPVDDPVCYVFGDVYFSPQAIKTIVDYEVDDVMFFASGPYTFGQGYPKSHAEPFAFKVNDTEYFKRCINLVKIFKAEGRFSRNPIAWEFWQVLRNTPLNQIINNYCQINDYTCDVDSVADAEKIQNVVSHLAENTNT